MSPRPLGVLIAGDKLVPLHCVVADFEVTDGVMKPRTFILDTDAALITGKGTISLKDEHLDLDIRGDPKSPTPVALGGPDRNRRELQETERRRLGAEAYVRGGAAVTLGVLLTPLAAVLGFIDSGDGKNADCSNLEQQANVNGYMPRRQG